MSEENKFDFDSSEEREPQSQQSETPPDDSNSIFADIMGALGVRDSPHRQRKGGNEKKKAPPNEDSNTLSQLEMDVRNSEWAASEEITFSPEEPTKRAEIIAIEGSRRKIKPLLFLLPVLLLFAVGSFVFFQDREPSPPAPDVVATYSGINITTEELKAFIKQEGIREMTHIICPAHGYDHSQCDPAEECESHPIDTLEGYQQMTARLAMEKMVMAWAEENGMLQREDIRHDMSDLLNDATVSQYATQLHQENLSPDSISSWEVQKYYDENSAAYSGKTLAEVEDEIRQILASQKDEDFFPQYIEKLKKTAGLQVNFDVLKVTEPTEQEVSAYYQQNKESYAVPETATYLEIRLTGDDAAKRATDAIRKIRSGESFDSVAASFSEEGKASEQTVKKENVTANGLQKLFTMKIGDVTDPIDNGDGSQSILKLKSKTEAGFQPVSEVSKEIRDTLLAEKTAKEYEQRKTETLFSIHSRRYTLGEFYTEFLELSETYQKEYVSFEKKKQLVEQIIAQELLLEESGDAASNGESAHDMEELKIQYLSQMIHQEEVDDKLAETTDEEARQYYEDNLDIMVLPSTIKLNLIWISQGENDEKKNQAKSKAEEALTALKDGTEFSTVAKQYSEDSSAENGGEIKSSFHEGELDPGLSKAISGLSAGEFSEIVDFAGGYYILQVRERTEARQLTFEEVSENIKAHLQEQQHEQLEADMEQTLLDRFGFTVYNKTLRQLMKEIASESTN